MIEIIAEKEKWNSLLTEFPHYDTYHTFDYHMIAKSKDETPILIKYFEGEVIIAIPLLIRNINDTPFKDATSIYGYSGPISKGITSNFDNTNFSKALINYFNDNKIISVFSRLNPYVNNQNKVLENIGETILLGKIINIDLTLKKDIQRQNYQNRLKNQINKSRKSCSIRKVTSINEIEKFIEIYNENMLRVNAKKTYFFSKEYFQKLYNCKEFETEILFAIDNETNQIISGAMFLKKNAIVQYHLSGTKNDFLHLMPTKLLIDEMRISATESGFKFLNLGGGLGANDEDSLFRFKSSFSKDFHQFYLWKLIINQESYDIVCKKNKVKKLESNFFPLYRLKEQV